MKRIIYQTPDGVAIITPAPEYADQIDAIAEKDVPSGKLWRIVDAIDLPSREDRARWRWTDSGSLTVTE